MEKHLSEFLIILWCTLGLGLYSFIFIPLQRFFDLRDQLFRILINVLETLRNCQDLSSCFSLLYFIKITIFIIKSFRRSESKLRTSSPSRIESINGIVFSWRRICIYCYETILRFSTSNQWRRLSSFQF